uniref:Uncharacterized protein n=1 Tax=Photinus pyralis TaxID=7054 RepID=A0A1Y1MML9_PHOPY
MVQLEDGADRASTLELPESTSGPSEDKVVEDDISEQVDGEKIERVGGSSALDLFKAAEETDGHSRASRHGGVGPMRTVAAKLMTAGEQDENKTREWPPTLLFVPQMPRTQV